VVGPEDRLSGAELWDPPLTGKGASCTSGGRSEVAGGVRKGRSDWSARAAIRVFTARLFGPSRHQEDSTELKGTDNGYIGVQLAGSASRYPY
jgi:hypothetical protein